MGHARVLWCDYWVSRDPRQTLAWINQVGSHGRVDYAYIASGRSYAGRSSGGPRVGSPPQNGRRLAIYYAASRPWLSTLQPRSAGYGLPLFLLALGVELALLFAIVRPRRSRGVRTPGPLP